MRSSGQLVETRSIHTFCGAWNDDAEEECSWEDWVDVTVDHETHTTYWTCPWCEFDHESTTQWLEPPC